jgi:hypothetical protein
MKHPGIVLAVACALVAGYSSSDMASAAQQETPVVVPSPDGLAGCFCSTQKEQECKARKLSCCATDYGHGNCKIYCGSACLAPY